MFGNRSLRPLLGEGECALNDAGGDGELTRLVALMERGRLVELVKLEPLAVRKCVELSV